MNSIEEKYILPNGRIPNVAFLVTFIDEESKQPYVVMIRNGKFKEYTQPAGKIDRRDVKEGFTETQLYIAAGIREFKEEALNRKYDDAFDAAIANVALNIVDREALGIPEQNKKYDTRIVTAFLGQQSVGTIHSWLKEKNEADLDAQEAFCVPVAQLAYSALRAQQEGSYTNYFMNRNGIELKVRPTFLAVLNGPVHQPEKGLFANIVNSGRPTFLR